MGGALPPPHPPGIGAFGADAEALGWDNNKRQQQLYRGVGLTAQSDIQGQRQLKKSNDGWAAFGRPPMVSMF